MKKTQKLLAVLLGVCFAVCMGLGIISVSAEETQPEKVENYTVAEETFDLTGGEAGWIFAVYQKEYTAAPHAIGDYAGVRLTFSGSKTSMINQFLFQLGPDDRCVKVNKWSLTPADGKSVFYYPVSELDVNNADVATFKPDKVTCLLQTTNGTADDFCRVTLKVELLAREPVEDRVIADRTSVTIAGGSVPALAISGWDEQVGGVNKPGTLSGYKYTKLSVYPTENGELLTRAFVKFGDGGSGMIYQLKDISAPTGKPYVSKAIGVIQNNGWQHLRFNIDSMTPQNEFDFDAKIEFVSIELVCTVRAGTPVGEKIIFDDFFLRTSKCDPSITEKEGFEKTYTTGTEVDFANAIETAHPFDDELNVSFGVKFSKTEDGEKQVVTVSGSTATLNKAGFYFVTATATDSMGASAQTEFTVAATGEDIDVEL